MEHVEENRRRKSTPLLHRPIHPNIRTALSHTSRAVLAQYRPALLRRLQDGAVGDVARASADRRD
jgi:hypothetical protein